MEKTAFEETSEEFDKEPPLKFGAPMPEAERKRIKVLLERIAMATASENGDPILNEISVISERTMNVRPHTIAELHAAGPVAVDGSGGRYFVHVRADGTGQIAIRWTSGIERTIEFSILEQYIVGPGASEVTKEDEKIKSRSEVLPSVSAMLSRHAFVFTLLAVALVFDLYRIIMLDEVDILYAAGSAIAICYFLGTAYVLRCWLIRRALGWAGAFLLSLLLYFGWGCLSVLASSPRIAVSLLLVSCVIATYKILRFRNRE